jgi:hypothetical protein
MPEEKKTNEHPAQTDTERERKIAASEPFSVQGLVPFLKCFADMYAPTKHEKKITTLTESAKRLLAIKRQWAQTCRSEKLYLTGKTAEPEANAVDHTFRREQRVAADGDPWENVLKAKNVDLWELLKATKSKLQAIETVVTSPEPASYFEPYVALYWRRLETLGVHFVSLLQQTYAGSCWKVFNDVRKRANEIYREIMTIYETEGAEISDEAAKFAQMQRETEEATAKVAA